MKKLSDVFFVLFSVGLIVPCSVTKASVLGGPVTNSANGHVYMFLSSQTWLDAEAEAITLGGHLTTVNDAAEDTWLWSTFGPSSSFMAGFDYTKQNFWIGLSDYASRPPGSLTPGTFVWADGEPFTAQSYTNWSLGNPSGESSGVPEMFVLKWGNHENVWNTPGEWNDAVGVNNLVPENAYQVGVMELIPEPSTFVLVGLSGLAMLGGVRRMRK
jgi:hypothetical protein